MYREAFTLTISGHINNINAKAKQAPYRNEINSISYYLVAYPLCDNYFFFYPKRPLDKLTQHSLSTQNCVAVAIQRTNWQLYVSVCVWLFACIHDKMNSLWMAKWDSRKRSKTQQWKGNQQPSHTTHTITDIHEYIRSNTKPQMKSFTRQ